MANVKVSDLPVYPYDDLTCPTCKRATYREVKEMLNEQDQEIRVVQCFQCGLFWKTKPKGE